MRVLIAIILLFTFLGCASISMKYKECEQVKKFFFKDETCPTGWSVPGITGHPPNCLSEKDYQEIKDYCGRYFD